MNKKIGIISAVILAIVIVIFTIFTISLSRIPVNIDTAGKDNPINVMKQPSQKTALDEFIVNETTTDAITGTVTKLDSKTITVHNIERGQTINLPEKVDAYSIDQNKGIIARDFSEVKKGSRVTVNYNVKSNIAVYVVIEP